MTELGISRIRPTIERRQQTYSDLVVNAIQAQARGYVNVCGTSATEAVESAAEALSKGVCFGQHMTGPPWAKPARSAPSFLGSSGPMPWSRAGQNRCTS